MRVWDTELIAKKEDGYVKNGLLLYLDGINNTRSGHDATSQYWEDLSGNVNDLQIVDGTKTTLQDNHYKFTGYTNGRMVLENFGAMKGTYEIVCRFTGVSYTGFALAHCPSANGQKCRAINFASSGRLSANGNVANAIRQSYTEFTNKLSTLSVTESDTSPIAYYVNGDISEISGSSSSRVDTLNGTKLILGARTYNNNYYDPYVGNVACVRIYDRVLTASEILHNYEIDKVRFGSGV